MSTLTKVSANQQTSSEIANALNQYFTKNNHPSLSDLNKQVFYITAQRIGKNVIGILAGGVALWSNPGAALMGGLICSISYACDTNERKIKFIPKFEVDNGQVVQVNEDFTKEVSRKSLKISDTVWIDIICTGGLALSHAYPTSILGAPIFTLLASFYLGTRAIDELHDISRQLFV